METPAERGLQDLRSALLAHLPYPAFLSGESLTELVKALQDSMGARRAQHLKIHAQGPTISISPVRMRPGPPPSDPQRNLDKRQKKFVNLLFARQERALAELSIKGPEIYAAYLAAGYTGIAEDAQKLIVSLYIDRAVHRRKLSLRERMRITPEWVVKQLVKNYRRAMQAKPVLDREGNETGEYAYEGNVANKSLELIGKHLGMFETKVKVTGQIEHVHAHLTREQIVERLEQLVSAAEARALPAPGGDDGISELDSGLGLDGDEGSPGELAL